MLKSKKEKREEIATHTTEVVSTIFGGFIAGGHIIGAITNFSKNLKQQRAISFVEGFIKYFEERTGHSIENLDFQHEGFIDLFDSVILKVISTKSEYKLERFRNILFNQAVDPSDDLMVMKFVDLLDSVNEIQLLMLIEAPTHFSESDYNYLFYKRANNGDVTAAVQHMNRGGKLPIQISNQTFYTDRNELEFYLNDLISLGLMNEQSVTKTSTMPQLGNDERRTEIRKQQMISKIGLKFLEFIKEC